MTVTDNQGATATATLTISVDKSLAVSGQVRVFPNPAQSILTAQISSAVVGNVQMNVYDMNGRTVMTGEVQKTGTLLEKTLNVSGLASGMYLLQLNIANQETMVTKFIKK